MEFPVERDGAEVVLTIYVDVDPECRSTGTPASTTIRAVDLDDAPWPGKLTAAEQDEVTVMAEVGVDHDDY